MNGLNLDLRKSGFQVSFLSAVDGIMHLIYGKRKTALLDGHPESIVEIGPGAGANFRYYRSGTHIIAIEPSTEMHNKLRQNAQKYSLQLDLRTLKAEAMDIEDESADMVVSSLVMCSVKNPEQVLGEIYRILKPGASFVFVEHVAAKQGTWLHSLQDKVHGPWFKLFDGCNTNRDTARNIRNAGFKNVRITDFKMVSPLIPVIPHIEGIAIK